MRKLTVKMLAMSVLHGFSDDDGDDGDGDDGDGRTSWTRMRASRRAHTGFMGESTLLKSGTFSHSARLAGGALLLPRCPPSSSPPPWPILAVGSSRSDLLK